MLGECHFSPNSSHDIEMEYFSKLMFFWSSLSLGVTFTPRLASLRTCFGAGALRSVLPRLVLAKVLTLACSLALSGPVTSLMLSFSRWSWGFLSLGVAYVPD